MFTVYMMLDCGGGVGGSFGLKKQLHSLCSLF